MTGGFYDRDGQKLGEIEIPEGAAHLAIKLADRVVFVPIPHPQPTSIRSMIDGENPPL